ncbi:hypothetical protein TNCV_2859381 [Trichonephila clavipes]|nr:hypothetical protein TNCV_2859381 [Trichonephila clavipes]
MGTVGGSGHELEAVVSGFRALLPLKDRRVEELMHVKSFEAQSPLFLVEWIEPSTTKDPPCRAAMHVKSGAETSSRWCGVVVKGCQGVVHVIDHGSK